MGRQKGSYSNYKSLKYGYNIYLCDKCTSKCSREIFYKEKEGIKYIPIDRVKQFSEMIDVGNKLWGWMGFNVDTLEDLIKLKENYLLDVIYRVIQNYKVYSFCYSSISNALSRYLKDTSKILCHKENMLQKYIINILWLFFGDPSKKDNKVKRLWMDYVKEKLNEEFFNMDIDDRYSRSMAIHNKTKQFKLEYYGQCQLCGKDIDETLYLSHIKPWIRCYTKKEKRDIDNTLLLCHDHDKLFDKKYISFDDNGNIILSDKLLEYQIIRYELDKYTKIDLNKNQLPYMEYHRSSILRK